MSVTAYKFLRSHNPYCILQEKCGTVCGMWCVQVTGDGGRQWDNKGTPGALCKHLLKAWAGGAGFKLTADLTNIFCPSRSMQFRLSQ